MSDQDKGLISRRDFILVSAGAAAAAGCQGAGGGTAAGPARTIDAGPVSHYATDGVYADFRDFGFFVIRRGSTLEVLSSICTHRHCKLDSEPDRTFSCPCHGSTFDADGKVTEGPARRNLPLLKSSVDAAAHLLVEVPAESLPG